MCGVLNVVILQPIIPTYRVPFFERLKAVERYDIEILAGFGKFLGLKTCMNADVVGKFDYELIPMFGGLFYWQRHLAFSLRIKEIDVLVLSGDLRLISNYLLILRAKKNNTKVVWWGHGNITRSTIVSFFRKLMFRISDAVVLYTDREVKDYADTGFDRSKLFGLNNTIDTDRIKAEIPKWNELKINRFSDDQGLLKKNKILFVGRLTEKSRLDVLLEALTYLPLNMYELIVIGSGVNENIYKGLSRRLGVDSSVHWLGEIYDECILAPYFILSTVFVYPGNVGLSLLHSFAYGLPAIIHDDFYSHPPEAAALTNFVNGLTFRYDSSKHLAEKIMYLASHHDLLESMRAESLRLTSNDYSIEHMVAEFKNALDYVSG